MKKKRRRRRRRRKSNMKSRKSKRKVFKRDTSLWVLLFLFSSS